MVALRRLLNLPFNAHCFLLPILTGVLPVFDENCKRSSRFINPHVTRHVLLTQFKRAYAWGINLPPGISQLPDEIKAKFQRLPPIFDDGHSNGTNGILPDVTGSEKSKMAVYKLVLSIYKLVDEIEKRFQRKTLYL